MGKWNAFSNDTEALKNDNSYYVYDNNNPNYSHNENRIVFYGTGSDEPVVGPSEPVGPDTPVNPDDPDTPGPSDTPDTPGPSDTPDTPDTPVEPDVVPEFSLNDSNIVQSAVDGARELKMWKSFVNKVDETKMEVNSAVQNFVEADTPMIQGMDSIMDNDDYVGVVEE